MRRFIPLFLLLGVVGAYVGYRLYLAHQPYEWTGTVEARTVSVGSRAGGRVKEVLVREGERVTADQPLLTLEPGDLPAQELIAQGQLDTANANLEKLQAGARPEEIEQAKARAQTANAALAESRAGARHEQIAAAQARVESALAAAEKAKLDHDRAHKLLESGAVAPAEAETADSTLRQADAQLDAQRRTLEELKNGTREEDIRQASARAKEAEASASLVSAGARSEDIKAAKAQVEAAQGRLDQIDVLIKELTIRAPRAARVETLDLRPGDLLTPSQAAATLFEDGQLFVRIYVPETLIGLMKVGQKVAVIVDSFPGRTFPGTVEHINIVGEYSPRNLQTADERADQVFGTRITLDPEAALDLRAGMAASIKVPK